MKNDSREPGSAPQADRWYNLKLGSSFKDQSKFCTLRYEFKPASIDKSQPGSLHKTKENKVTVEFLNNQPGKPKVSFQGSSEDYKDNEGALFFNGDTFRLERLHRSVKRLRHVRLPGESAGATMDARSPPLGKPTNKQSSKPLLHSVPVEVEKIDIGEPDSPGPKRLSAAANIRPIHSDPFAPPPETKAYEDNMDHDLDIDGDTGTPTNMIGGMQEAASVGFDINVPQMGMDDEIADVDDSDDEAAKGTNAAEALRAQVNAQGGQNSQETSSSSSSSGSGSSGSGSGSGSSSSSSDSDADSRSSGGNIDI